MERLTMRPNICQMASTEYCLEHKDCYECEHGRNVFRKLCEYEDLEEQGRLKQVVCDVGDTVWDKEVEPWDVISIEWFSRKVTHLHCVSPVTGIRHTFAVGKRSLGKTVFLTRPEAEAAIASLDARRDDPAELQKRIKGGVVSED